MSKPTIPLTPGSYFHIYNRGINSCPIFHDDADHERFLYLYGKYVSPVADTLAWVLMRTHIHFLIRIKEDVVYRYTMEEIRRMQAAQRTDASAGHPASANGSLPRNTNAEAIELAGNTAGLSPSPEDALSFAKWETVNLPKAGRQDSGTSAGVGMCARDFRASAGCGEAIPGRQQTRKPTKTPNPSSHLGHFFNAHARYFNLKYNRHGSLFEHQFKRKPIEDERYLRNVVGYIHKNPAHHGYYADFKKYPWSSFHSCLSGKPGLIDKKEVFQWFGDKANFIFFYDKFININQLDEWLDEE